MLGYLWLEHVLPSSKIEGSDWSVSTTIMLCALCPTPLPNILPVCASHTTRAMATIHKQCLVFILFISFLDLHVYVKSITLDDNAEKYVLKTIREFELNSRSTVSDHVILPPNLPEGANSQKEYMLPKSFIWCPISHYQLPLCCPNHECILELGQWTDVLTKLSYRNPRMVYNIDVNMLLIQRSYLCRQNHHRLLSARKTVIESLPRYISSVIPFNMYHRAGCSKHVLDMTENLVFKGVNFLKISEIMASLNYQSYCRRAKTYLSVQESRTQKYNPAIVCLDDFYADIQFSFPSPQLLIHIYLEHFQELKPYYEH